MSKIDKEKKESEHIDLYNSLQEALQSTGRIDRRRIIKAKMNRINSFLKMRRMRDESLSKMRRMRDESLSRMFMLVSRHKYILKYKPSRLYRLRSSVKRLLIKIVDKFSSYFSLILSPLSPPPVMHSSSRTFSYKELQSWSRSFSIKLMGQIKERMEKWREELIRSSKFRAYIEKEKKRRVERREKSIKLLKSASTKAVQKGKDTAFKYVK